MRWPNFVRMSFTLAVGFVVGRWSTCGEANLSPPLSDAEPDVLPDLYTPPPRLGDVTVPSVVADERGEVHNLRIGDVRFNVLVSHAGTLRSGDCHQRRQLDMIFEGRVRVTTREGGRDVERVFGAGELVIIPAHVPHIFNFLNKTIMAEWWEGGVFETRYYRPFRQVVDAALARAREHGALGPRHKTTLPSARRHGRRQAGSSKA